MFKFLHAADLHLDSPLHGLGAYDGAPTERLRAAGRAALENLVKLAISERVRFVLLSGDVFDGDWEDYNTGLFFVSQLGRLREQGIPVFLISGNHDAASRITRSLPYPNNVRSFPADQPQTHFLDDIRVAVHGQSYAEQKELRNLAAGYPAARPGWLNIALLHTALDGREGHERYAPCKVDELLAHDYDYWALGHVHQRESQGRPSGPLIEFPGNIQGRHVRECGAKGCLLVHVDSSRNLRKEFRALDVCRWSLAAVDCGQAESRNEVLERIHAALQDQLEQAEGRLLALRLRLEGACPIHDYIVARQEVLREEARSLAVAHGSDNLWIERLEVRTRPAQEESTPLSDDAFAIVDEVTAQLRNDPQALESLLAATELRALLRKLPPELREGADALDEQDPVWKVELVERARALLRQTALGKEAE